MKHAERGRKLLTASQAARMLTAWGLCNKAGKPVHRSTIDRYWRSGQMPSSVVRGRRRMSVEQLEQWYDANVLAAPTQKPAHSVAQS